jgi:general secretion pathway protein D
MQKMSLQNLINKNMCAPGLLEGLVCLAWAFCVSLAGCHSDSAPVAVHPEAADTTQAANDAYAQNTVSRQIAHLNSINTDYGVKNESDGPASLAAIRAGGDAAGKLESGSRSAADLIKNVLPATESQAYSFDEPVNRNQDAVPSAEHIFSQAHHSPHSVNMPVLDEPGMADELISVNFEQVDIRTVIKTVGDITGINFVVDDNVQGTVTMMSPTRIRLAKLYDVLESILEVRGYAAVPAEDLVKIVPRADAVRRNLQVRVGSNPEEIPKNDSIITQIIPLSYADAVEVSNIVQPLLAEGSQMATYPRTNSIVVTDTSSNIHHIAKIIQKLDVTGSKEQVTVFTLEHASAQVLSEQITHIMEKQKTASSQPTRGRNIPHIQTEIKILPDVRTNSLIVVANAQDTEMIAGLISQLDIQRPMGNNNVHVVYLKNGQAVEVAKSLTAALSNLKIAGVLEAGQQVNVTADEGTNALIIAASAQDFEVLAEIIDKLDIYREQVFVEMLIMEVGEDSLRKIGVDWATLDESVEDSARVFAATNFGPRVDFASGTLEGLAVGLWKGAGANVRVASMMHALEKQSGVNILSTPHILTSNHIKAKIIVGESRPFVTQSKITEGTDPITPTVIQTFEYKDVGITMEITPHISQGGLIRLEIKSEFSKLIEDITSIAVNTPSTAKREAETVVSMNSGSTVVIGGLIRDDKITIKKKVPLVADIPLIGGLFSFDKDELQKTNLLIFITPHIMSSQEDMQQITEEKRDEIGSELEDIEQRY